MKNLPVVPALHYVTQTLFFFWLVVQNCDRDPVRDPIRSGPIQIFVEAALETNVSCFSRHHDSLVNVG